MASVENQIPTTEKVSAAPKSGRSYSPENPKTAQQRNLTEASAKSADAAALQKIEQSLAATKFYLGKLDGSQHLKPEIVKNLEWNAETKLNSLLSRCGIDDPKLMQQAQQKITEQIGFSLQNFSESDTTVYSKLSGFLHKLTGGKLGNKITGGEYEKVVANLDEVTNRIFSIFRSQEKNGKSKPEAFQKALDIYGDGSVIQTPVEKQNAFENIREQGLNPENGVNFVVDALTMDYGNEFVAAIEAGDRQQIEALVKKIEASVGINILGGKILEKGGGALLKFLRGKSEKLALKFQKLFPEIPQLQPAYATAGVERGVITGVKREMPGNVMMSEALPNSKIVTQAIREGEISPQAFDLTKQNQVSLFLAHARSVIRKWEDNSGKILNEVRLKDGKKFTEVMDSYTDSFIQIVADLEKKPEAYKVLGDDFWRHGIDLMRQNEKHGLEESVEVLKKSLMKLERIKSLK
jgi:hypothetical protein